MKKAPGQKQKTNGLTNKNRFAILVLSPRLG